VFLPALYVTWFKISPQVASHSAAPAPAVAIAA